MTDRYENSASPYAPPAVHSFADDVPPGMELVAEDRELAACLKIRKQSPRSCLTCLAFVAIWTSFISTLFGGLVLVIPPPQELFVPLLTMTAALGAVALTSVPIALVALQRPERRFAISARGIGILWAESLFAGALWGTAAFLFDGVWRESIGILLLTVPVWVFLALGLPVIWAARYASRRLGEAGISESAVAVQGSRIYDFRP